MCAIHPFTGAHPSVVRQASYHAMCTGLRLSSIKMRERERQDWLIQLANREGAWPKRPYECFWLKVGVFRKSQG